MILNETLLRHWSTEPEIASHLASKFPWQAVNSSRRPFHTFLEFGMFLSHETCYEILRVEFELESLES